MKSVDIEILDPIHSRIKKEQISLISPSVEYKVERWTRGQFGMNKKKSIGSFIDGRGGLFLTGLIPRIKQYCKTEKIKINWKGSVENIPAYKPNLTKIKLRNYQLDGVRIAVDLQRGLIVSPTGTGKTITMAGICSALFKADILILCHTTDLMKQLYQKMTWIGFKSVYRLNQNFKEHKQMPIRGGNILIALIQSFSKVAKDYTTYFDAVIVDEAHKCIGIKSMYSKTLQNLLAPVRIGFTATAPTNKKDLYSLEGLLGPVIYELPDEKAQDMGVLVKPTIKLVISPYSSDIADQYRKFKDIRTHAICLNKERNSSIMKIAVDAKKDKKRVLIIAREIKHLEQLQKIGIEQFKSRARLVHGKVRGDVRDQIKKYLNEKTAPIIICSVVWKEGIDIPELDVVILADIGKSSQALLQSLGRGRRVTKTKKNLEVYDFLDSYRYLSEHTIKRLQVYVEKGWL